MGNEFSNDREGAPEPPSYVTNTYVLHNGQYESSPLPSQYVAQLDPSNFDGAFQSSVATFGEASLWRPLHPPDLRTTKLIKSPLHLRRQALSCYIEEDGGRLILEVGYDATAPTIFEIFPKDRTLRRFFFKTVREERGTGMAQVVRVALLRDARRLVVEDDFTAFSKGENGFEAVVVIARDRMKAKQESLINGQVSDIRIFKQGTRWRAELASQALIYEDNRWDLQEIFGVKHAAAGSASPTNKNADEAGLSKDMESTSPAIIEDEGFTDCIICMSEPRDTLVLPCRHMAFCRDCAGVMRFQCEKCPICRQGVTSLLMFKQDGEDSATS